MALAFREAADSRILPFTVCMKLTPKVANVCKTGPAWSGLADDEYACHSFYQNAVGARRRAHASTWARRNFRRWCTGAFF